MRNNLIENTTGPFIHSVYFWLKNPNKKEDITKFEVAIKKMINTNLQAISYHLGIPAASEERAVVDNSFDYFYMMIFPDLENHNTYQTDPTHLLFIEEASHLWERVVIYDSISKAV
ncbi:Dabb family protein [Flavobacteriaceae bacterium]|jgi:hypothetical protein|nr:Dabb family protein [Flavobacteriaceae bacterium]MDC1378031.1 Dabb family protein [Flavobacteriaceae bacterium]|tara:strand:- start:209 stop:556 length:348 start_codon:yes stop_codon:yes gene_type:complete